MGSASLPVKKLAIWPQSFNHFWPRLWLTAKPVGTEARDFKKTGELPEYRSTLDDIDTRIFVRGGDWVLDHLDLITSRAEIGAREGTIGGASGKTQIGNVGTANIDVGSSQKAAMSSQGYRSATCVLFSEGSSLYNEAGCGLAPPVLQGIVAHMHPTTGKVDLKVAQHSNKFPVRYSIISKEVTHSDIWWCFPFWVAAGYALHGGKVPVDAGYYFLAEPGQEFQVVTVNWAEEDFLTENRVDGTATSMDQWLLSARACDGFPVVSSLYESTTTETGIEGARFTFQERPNSQGDRSGWEEQLKSEAGLVTESIFRTQRPMLDLFSESELESDRNSEDNSDAEESSDEERRNDPEFDEKPSRALGRKWPAKRRWSGPSRKKRKTHSDTKRSRGGCKMEWDNGESTPVKKSIPVKQSTPVKKSTPVKQDSKWALHRSMAPAQGPPREDKFVTISLKKGEKLGEKVAHYRDARWFKDVDLMLQEEGLRAARASSHRGATGRSAANPIALPDDDDDVTNHVAGAGVQPPRYRAPKVEPGGDFGSPSRRSKLLKVHYYVNGKGGTPAHVVQVPRSQSPLDLKREAKQALADPDVAEEKIHTAQLRWTFIDEDKCEVDISKHTTADDFHRSPAINVYVRV